MQEYNYNTCYFLFTRVLLLCWEITRLGNSFGFRLKKLLIWLAPSIGLNQYLLVWKIQCVNTIFFLEKVLIVQK